MKNKPKIVVLEEELETNKDSNLNKSEEFRSRKLTERNHQLNIKVTYSFYRAVKEKAFRDETTISKVIEKAFYNYSKQNEVKS